MQPRILPLFFILLSLLTTGCQTTQTATTTTTSTTTITLAANIVLNNINIVANSLGVAEVYGEVVNDGNDSAGNVRVYIDLMSASGEALAAVEADVNGTVMILQTNSIAYNDCLAPGNIGAFSENCKCMYADIANYSYYCGWDDLPLTYPSASLEIVGNVTYMDRSSYLFPNIRTYYGFVKNTGTKDIIIAALYLCVKNASGEVVDLSHNSITSNGLSVNQTMSFEAGTCVASSEIESYYFLFDWWE